MFLKAKLIITGYKIITKSVNYTVFEDVGYYWTSLIEIPRKSSTVIVFEKAAFLSFRMGTVYERYARRISIILFNVIKLQVMTLFSKLNLVLAVTNYSSQ